MNIAEWLRASARLHPGAPALLSGERVEADYRAFAQRAAGLAAGLAQEHGVGPGDRVALFMKNRTEYLEGLYAILWLGAAAVPVNNKLHPREAAWICEASGASAALISDDPGAGLAEAAPDLPLISADHPDWARLRALPGADRPAEREDEDLAWLFYTSGTTGRPKGAMLSHGAIRAASLCYPADVDEVGPGDCALYAAPMSHGAGFYNFIHVRMAARHCAPPSAGFDPGEILDLAPRLRGVSFFAAPTMVTRLVEAARAAGATGEGIKTIVYGGGPMYVADIEAALKTLGPRFVQIYGQGEAPMCISALSRELVGDRAHPRWRERLASVGVAQSCVELRIGDEDGAPLPAGETGEIMCRGPMTMSGYWQAPEATAKTLVDGWLRTGDVGRLDEDGFLTLTDRSKDMIITGGTNVYPREVEEALLTHPDVREASVIGRPHPDWGEEIVAFVSPVEGAEIDIAALDRHCLESIARFKRPKTWRVVEDLPKNAYGKILKTDLRARLAAEGEGEAQEA